jgi:ABC-type cobalamin transport system ATPase subunit
MIAAHRSNVRVNPLETLIVQQIRELRTKEQTLAQKYASLAVADETRTRSELETQVSDLYRRADRLMRMIEQMNSGNLRPSFSQNH